MLAALERWLLGRAAASPGPDPLVAHAVARLFGAAPPHTDALAEILEAAAPRDLAWTYVPRRDLRHDTIYRAESAPAFRTVFAVR